MSENLLDKVRIVLVGTTHPGNIGAAARSMKAMGMRRLVLVDPKIFPCAEATARASGADDILQVARVCASLSEAVSGCGAVIGTSARHRALSLPVIDAADAARRIVDWGSQGEVAVVFGREHSGLSNEELELCHRTLRIPTDLNFSSLNLAAAVQIVVYEIRCAAMSAQRPAAADQGLLANPEEMARFYRHLEEAMLAVGFYDPAHPRRLLRRLKRLFNRAMLDREEVQMLRGFLAAIQKKSANPPQGHL